MRYLLIILPLLFCAVVVQADEATPPKRVVSIGGALTEIIYALEADALLIGSDTTSTFPAVAKALPKIGYQRALSAEGILSLNPDLVLLTTEAGPPAVLKQLETAGVRIVKAKCRAHIRKCKRKYTTNFCCITQNRKISTGYSRNAATATKSCRRCGHCKPHANRNVYLTTWRRQPHGGRPYHSG